MALNWNWNEQIGRATFVDVIQNRLFDCDLYQGNAFLIFLHRHDGETDLVTFFLDKQHMKNCLGLNNKYRDSINILNHAGMILTGISINKKKYPYYKDLISALVQAFDDLDIVLYSE